jgi:hypothetical protein
VAERAANGGERQTTGSKEHYQDQACAQRLIRDDCLGSTNRGDYHNSLLGRYIAGLRQHRLSIATLPFALRTGLMVCHSPLIASSEPLSEMLPDYGCTSAMRALTRPFHGSLP